MREKEEIKILQQNMRDLQKQLVDAQKRILELMNDKTESDSKVIEQKRFIQEIRGQLARVDEETVEKINKFMSDIPDVVDSKQVLKEGK
tara:strand:- start:260 stop:526 length:267 start_codon:yes stop_codon:yes gene_type:complete